MGLFRKLLIFIIGVTIVFASIFGFLSWQLIIKIYDVTYLSKAGISFWQVWTLNNHLFTAALLLTICSMLTIPSRSTAYSFYRSFAVRASLIPIGKRIIIPWRILQFVFLYLAYLLNGGFSLSGVNIAFLLFLSTSGVISITPNQFGQIFSLILNPGTSYSAVESLVPAFEAFNFYAGLFSTIIIFTVIRLFLSAGADLIGKFRPNRAIIKGSLGFGLISASGILSIHTWTVNVGTWLGLVQISVQTLLFLGLAILTAINVRRTKKEIPRVDKLTQLRDQLRSLDNQISDLRIADQSKKKGSPQPEKPSEELRALYKLRRELAYDLYKVNQQSDKFPLDKIPTTQLMILAVPFVIILVATPIYHALVYGVQLDGAHYQDWKFETETLKSIKLTKWAAGINFTSSTLDDFIEDNTTFNPDFLSSIRQWDHDHAYTKMVNQIGVNWMKLADSDVIYWQGHEYWIAPLTLNPSVTEGDFINQHFRYTHAEGLVAINSYDGTLITDLDFQTTFNISGDTPLYYGDGYNPEVEVFVNIPGQAEVGNTSYQEEPDYTLSGFESILFMFGRLGWSFMGQTLPMIIERDVSHRVQSILLQGLTVDSDPYPVFSPDGELYFAVSIYTDYPLSTGYAQSNYHRFLGVALVNVKNGEIGFYKTVESLIGETFLDRIYSDFYPWQETPEWLQEQLRYPEDLWETQMETDFYYHVEDALTWRSQEDVFHRPDGTDVHYILIERSGVTEFVGAQIVEFARAEGQNLAGIYLVGGGTRAFGKSTFYRAGGTGGITLFGPTSARQALISESSVAQFLQLLGTYEFGNLLLYQISGKLLYVIPIYKELGSGAAITKLAAVGLVDALTGENVTLGSDVIKAYQLMFGLGNETVPTTSNVTLNEMEFIPDTITSGASSQLPITVNNDDTDFHNVTVRITTYTPNINISQYGIQITPTVAGDNRTHDLPTWELGPGDYYGTTLNFTAKLDQGALLEQYKIDVELWVDGSQVFTTDLILTVRT